MARKISLIIVTVGAALVFAVPAGAKSSLGGCLESVCQPTGARPIDKQPRSQAVRPKVQPTLYTDGQQQTWRAGSHIMY